MTTKAERWYQERMSLSPLARLNRKADPPSTVAEPRWQRLERRIAAMMLQAIPESTRDELVAARKMNVFSILTHLFADVLPWRNSREADALEKS